MKTVLSLSAVILLGGVLTASAYEYKDGALPAPPAPPAPPGMMLPPPPAPPAPPPPPLIDFDQLVSEVQLACQGKKDGDSVVRHPDDETTIEGRCLRSSGLLMFELDRFSKNVMKSKD